MAKTTVLHGIFQLAEGQRSVGTKRKNRNLLSGKRWESGGRMNRRKNAVIGYHHYLELCGKIHHDADVSQSMVFAQTGGAQDGNLMIMMISTIMKSLG